MIRIAHIVNPVPAAAASELGVAQPVTFATMRSARALAARVAAADVELLAVQLKGESEVSLPPDFARLAPLKRSVADLREFRRRRNLPLLGDILQRLYDASAADTLIYTNVDIALQPHFYWAVARLTAGGHEAFAVNRRTLHGHFRGLADLPLMYAELGREHKGWDCFVFRRSLVPQLHLGRVCIGAGWVGRALLANLACLARNFKVFTDLHLTFHIGNEQAWKADDVSDYVEHNRGECRRILLDLEARFGPLDRGGIPGRFLSLLEGKGET